jgi:hypothetical protein
MNRLVKDIFARLRVTNVAVNVQQTLGTVACVKGINLSDFLPVPVRGTIYIDDNYLQQRQFSDNEIIFILAHECVHIYRNHIVSKMAWEIFESFLKGAENKNYNIVESIKNNIGCAISRPFAAKCRILKR